MDPRERFHDVAALFSAGFARPGEVVRAACDVLAATGEGGDAMAMLAGLSEATADDHDVEELVQGASDELGLTHHPRGSTGALEHAAAAKAREFVAGAITPRAFARWAGEVIGYDRDTAANQIAAADAFYPHEPDGPSHLDDDVRAEAEALIAAVTAPGHTRR